MNNKISDKTTFYVSMRMIRLVDNPAWWSVLDSVETSVWHPVWDSAWGSEQIIKNCISQASRDYFKQK